MHPLPLQGLQSHLQQSAACRAPAVKASASRNIFMFSSCIFERTRFGFRPAVAGPAGSNPRELGRRRKGLIGKAKGNDRVTGAQSFDRDDFPQMKSSCESDRSMRLNDHPAIQALALSRLAAGALTAPAGVDLHRIGLGGDPHEGQTANQGYCQPHRVNVIPNPPLSNGGRKLLWPGLRTR